jgi:NAD(P)-dependent dehydrogenase (short-subunit alcohol dehydrogenase family)
MAGEIRYDGQVAIVTGAGAGLGRTYALELGRRGAKVVVNDLGGARDGSGSGSLSAADKVVDEIKAAGGIAVANYDNVATVDGGKNIVKTAMDNYGKVDILINNAGILRDKSFLKMEPENWDAVVAVHLRGAYCVTQPAFAVMREKQYGRIVLTSSTSGIFGNFGQSNYGAAKMGLVGMMNCLKFEGVKYNITVNTLAPFAASRLTEDVLPPELFQAAKPEFVTPLVLYLVSTECTESGSIYRAGNTEYARIAIVSGPAVKLGDADRPATVEEVRDNWQKIRSIEGATEPERVSTQLVRPPKS